MQRHFLRSIIMILSLVVSSLGSAVDDSHKIHFEPWASLFLPGSSQIWEGDMGLGLSFTSVAVLSAYWQDENQRQINELEKKPSFQSKNSIEKENFKNRHHLYQQKIIAAQLYLGSGALASYQSFQKWAAHTSHRGTYSFLPEQTPHLTSIFVAPFRFEYLTRPTTAIPLLVIAGLTAMSHSNRDPGFAKDSFTGQDFFFSSAISYNAGTSEETLFRGWLLPYFYGQSGSFFAANLLQSSLFAASHANQTRIPIFQFALGYYFAWLTKMNKWDIGESIFLHSWWDVFALSIQYSSKEEAVVWLPPIKFSF